MAVDWLPAPLLDLADLVWPARCAGCAGRGASWCPQCADALAGSAFPGGPVSVRPTPAPAGMPPAHAWGAYRGVVRTVLVAYKDRDRRDLVRVLAPLLAASLAAAVHAQADATGPRAAPGRRTPPTRPTPPGALLVVPVPSNPAAVRHRGDRPLERLGARATALLGTPAAPADLALAWAPCLRVVRGVGDQAGLDRRARSANLAGAFATRPGWAAAVRDARCIVVDDVVTTGATLTEAARALRTAGAATVSCATIAATARRAWVRRSPG